jgi:serine/threonine protein kinase
MFSKYVDTLYMSELDPNKAKIDDFIRGLPRVIPHLTLDKIPRATNIRFPESAFGTGYISEDGQHAVKIINLKQRIEQTPVDNIIESLKSELKNYYAITQICSKLFCNLVGYHYDIPNTTLTIVMENCGTDLFYIYSTESKPIKKTQINHIGQIIDAIKCLHENRYVHFDIKPENIVLHGKQIKLIDAGSLTYVNNNIAYVRGTPLYLAPELRGEITIKNNDILLSTDIYSFGKLCLFIILPFHIQQYIFSDNSILTNLTLKQKHVITDYLKHVFGETIEFKDFFGEPTERLTIKQLKSMYEQTQILIPEQSLDQTTPSGGRSIRKTHKRRSNKRRLDKRQRKSKSKSKSNK